MSEYLGIWKSEIQDKLVVGKKITSYGNTVQDGLNGLQISYNILNLPQTITTLPPFLILEKAVVYNQDNAEKGISKKDVELGNKNEELSIDLENIIRKLTNHKERPYEYYKFYKTK